jgi:hypothetical protein
MKSKFSIISVLLILFACQKESRKTEFLILSTNEVKIEGSTENGVVFSASILMENNEPILEQGFAYGLNSNPDHHDQILKSSNSDEGTFKMSPNDVLIPDTTYYVRSFAKTNKYLTYGNQVSFYSNGSEPPVLEKIEPAVAFWGDTVMITGQNFDHSGLQNKVWFNKILASRSWGKKDTIYAVVPPALKTKKSEVSVTLYGKRSQNAKAFEIHSPVIHSISHTEGQYPDTVMIEGDYLSERYGELHFGNTKLKMIDASVHSIKFMVPFLGDAQNVDIKLIQLNETAQVKKSFLYNKQAITGISRDSIHWNDTITIHATNLDFRRAKFSILFEGRNCIQVAKWKDSISFIPSYNLTSDLEKKDFRLSIQLHNPPHELFTTTIYQKAPEILKLIDTKVGYNRRLTLQAKGFYRSDIYTSIVVQSENGTNNKAIWRQNVKFESNNILHFTLPMESLPGKNAIFIETGGRKSDVFQFDILEPQITSVSITNPNRSSYITVNGNFLPPSYTSYQIRHIDSGMIVPLDYKTSPLDPSSFTSSIKGLIGRGNYQVEIVIGDLTYVSPITFFFEDYFEIVMKRKKITHGNSYATFAFGCNNKLYSVTSSGTEMIEVDMQTGESSIYQSSINLGDYTHFPIIIGDDVFVCANYKVYQFDKENISWQLMEIPAPNDTVHAIGTYNNNLILYNKRKEFYQYNGSFTKIGEGSNIQWFIFGKGDFLYNYYSNVDKWHVPNSQYLTTITSPLYRPGTFYGGKHIFLHKEKMYVALNISGYMNDISFLQFSLKDESFTLMKPAKIPRHPLMIKFHPCTDGNVYMTDQDYIYKFDPQ